MAFLGCIVLCLLITITCLSVLGRELNGVLHWVGSDWAIWLANHVIRPVNGDYELVEAGMAFAIFAFLPYCQITNGHAVVDIFTAKMSPTVNRILHSAAAVIFALVLVLIAAQLFGGLQSKLRSGQTTFLLEFPVWWSYAASMLGATVAVLVAVYMALMRSAELGIRVKT